VFSWFKKKSVRADRENAAALYKAVRTALGDDDDVHVRIVASIAALFTCVAYADTNYDEAEENVTRQVLGRVHGLDAAGVNAIAKVLRADTVRITGAEATTYAREILELTEEEFRLELLDALMDVAAADDVITVSETNILREITRALGLSPDAYLAAQARHRDKLAVLKRD
jgi:uncharacterized tellurite resistance protein B-like protein